MGLILYEMIYSRCPFDSIMETHGNRAMFYIADSRMTIQFPDCPRLHSIIASLTKTTGKDLQTASVRHLDCKPQFFHVITVLQGCLDRDPETRLEVFPAQIEMMKLPAVVALPEAQTNSHAKSNSVYGRRYTFLSTQTVPGKVLRVPSVDLANADAEATVFLDTKVESPQEKKQKELLEQMEQFLQQCGGGPQEQLVQAWKERLAILESSSD